MRKSGVREAKFTKTVVDLIQPTELIDLKYVWHRLKRCGTEAQSAQVRFAAVVGDMDQSSAETANQSFLLLLLDK